MQAVYGLSHVGCHGSTEASPQSIWLLPETPGTKGLGASLRSDLWYPSFCSLAARLASLLIVFAGVTTSARADDSKPNFLVIVADDLGWADVGYHGSPIPTPHLDRLALEGVELNQHYVAPVCTPTRTALLTGRYWSRFGNTAPSNAKVLPDDTETLASALAGVGYATCLNGKWHLGSRPEWGPRKFGFERSHGSLAGGVGPWNHLYKRGPYSRTWHRDDELLDETGHVTDLLAEGAVEFLASFGPGGNDGRPFFLYVPFTAVHHPLDEPAEWAARGKQADPTRPQFAAATIHLDDGIGRILEALDGTGRRENTLVVFFSDNGGMETTGGNDLLNYPGTYPADQMLGSNKPLRGRKTQVYEGGIRVPAVAQWKGRLAPRRLDVPIHVIDWMPTLAALAGYEPSRDLKWDGRDVWPWLSDASAEPTETRTLYWLGPGGRSAALRRSRWKLVVTGEMEELFDLGHDPNETTDLIALHADVADELRRLLEAERGRDNDAVPNRDPR